MGSLPTQPIFRHSPEGTECIAAALSWVKVDNYVDVQGNVRYTCEQNEDMAGYGWEEYDTRKGGVQTIHDAKNQIDMTTMFVKIPGGAHGGSWAARIKGEPREDAPADLKTTVIFYLVTEGMDETIDVAEGAPTGFDEDVTFTGTSKHLGGYKLVVTKGKGAHPTSDHPASVQRDLEKTVVHSDTVPLHHLWQAKKLFFQALQEGLPNTAKSGNIQIVQKVFEGPFEFDVLFSSESSGKDVTSEDLSREIKLTTEAFNDRFQEIFAPKAPFDTAEYEKFGKSMLSNLAGGIGYFYGQHLVDRSDAPEYEEENEGFWEGTAEARGRRQEQTEGPYELFSSIPSRPFFPRGFLWDEGFHLLPIIDWDTDLALEIVKSWYNLMDEDGWIAREQILGEEARRLEYLRNLYPLLRRQYLWFKKTQFGDIKSYDREAYSNKEAYRWRGRSVQHCLTSGLDDYPRPQPPHPGELHVDLLSWMGMMTRTLAKVADVVGLPQDAEEYKKALDGISHNLVDLHWSEARGCFCDATIDDFEEHSLVCHKGYISLFPFLMGLLEPNDVKLGKVLDLVGDESELFSPHGIRSLSKKSVFYGTDENYWRSPVWININYLVLVQLRSYALQDGPFVATARDLYNRLRQNLVQTVYKSWEETGFAWEQYNPETGAGQRTQHFTGWTSLVVKMMAMDELTDGSSNHVRDEL
ncbi:hypothetical protein CIB48_g2978 [Xylaria polymorpha]|nr:hypothetical protein CIB48_g2978 [Xylaria polymorpha]